RDRFALGRAAPLLWTYLPRYFGEFDSVAALRTYKEVLECEPTLIGWKWGTATNTPQSTIIRCGCPFDLDDLVLGAAIRAAERRTLGHTPILLFGQEPVT